jgi:hypothetical protein
VKTTIKQFGYPTKVRHDVRCRTHRETALKCSHSNLLTSLLLIFAGCWTSHTYFTFSAPVKNVKITQITAQIPVKCEITKEKCSNTEVSNSLMFTIRMYQYCWYRSYIACVFSVRVCAMRLCVINALGKDTFCSNRIAFQPRATPLLAR